MLQTSSGTLRVRQELIAAENNMLPSDSWWEDLEAAGRIGMVEWWRTFSETGVLGGPTLASSEEGEALQKASAEELAALIREFQARPARPGKDRH